MVTPEESTSDLLRCKLKKLREKLQGLGLPISGSKAVLVDRLKKATEGKSEEDAHKDKSNDEKLEALTT
ncbi:hypothetical protein PV327_008734 [Microctonus hyperodae]|uniref:SAP domain-containing protein n=1 Tax=Microctonus hyperodae TaxID=165561 RepID=A0AA39FSZ2_MICHY|nr:hypothetical protein PV327_008734 [Microctonus hyperodae]